MSLTALERETVISTSDDDDFWLINTCQRRMVTQLLKNPSAEIVEDYTHSGSRFITAKLPANGITVRKGSRKVSGAKTKRKRVMTNTATCAGIKSDGSKCGSVTLGDTGFCRHHQNQKKK